MSSYDTLVHLIAGGTAGTVGAIVTCPLEVIKTRLQSSIATDTLKEANANAASQTQAAHPKSSSNVFKPTPKSSTSAAGATSSHTPLTNNNQHHSNHSYHHTTTTTSANSAAHHHRPHAIRLNFLYQKYSVSNLSMVKCFRSIVKNEGWKALFKGLGPNLVGNAPSRAIYFSTYSTVKSFLNKSFSDYPEHPLIHMTSAAGAGFVSCTATNPIWLIKTRLQLSKESMTVAQCVRSIYKTSGAIGFYKGLSASYIGISETIVHFVIYEFFKAHIKQNRLQNSPSDDKFDKYIFFQYMIASATSKSCACSIAYPHEVARTRLREEGTKYTSFGQTIYTVWREEGFVGLYRGLSIQLLRAIPFTAITMSTYELVVSLLSQGKVC